MAGHKSARPGTSKGRVQPPQSGGLVDMEVNCLICRGRLYVPDTSIEAVLASLEQTGAAVLICPNGHAQLIKRQMPPGRQPHA